MAFRLQTPSVLKWKDSFALVVKSSQEGLTLVSPSEGIISLNNEKVSNFLISSLNPLKERQKKLHQQNQFHWFWTVIKKYKLVLIQVLI